MAKSAQTPSAGRGSRRGRTRAPAPTRPEGPPAELLVTHKELIAELTRTVRFVRSVQSILHSSATKQERQALAQLSKDLANVGAVVAEIECPNPMFNIVTVDSSRLDELDR
jgi:hypothetical protein